MPKNLRRLFSPRSIAIIGASQSPEKVGAVILKNIIESNYSGLIFPVNPNVTEINGLKVYSTITSLPQTPDLAVFAIPAPLVVKLLPELAVKGIQNLVVLSSGFKEIGPIGLDLENQLLALAKKYHLNLLGPNCLGFADNLLPLNLTFGQLVKKPGKLRLISQSGALATALFDWLPFHNLGFDRFVTLGNKTIIDESHILDFWLKQSTSNFSTPIGLYLESINRGPEFLSLATQISRHVPIFILKPGKSSVTAQAMRSHTGSIAGEDNVLDIALKQSGIIRCPDLSTFFDLYQALSCIQIPTGPKLAIISNAGGPAVIATDALTSTRLQLATFSLTVQRKLQQVLPSIASFKNPIDLMGDALSDRFTSVLEIIFQDKSVDSILLILTPQLMTDIENIANSIDVLSKKYSKPLLCSFIGGHRVLAGKKILNQQHVPCFSFPERAINVLASLWSWQQWRQIPLSSSTLKTAKTILAKTNHHQALDNLQADDLIQSAGISAPPSLLVSDINFAQKFAAKYHYPVVLKLSSSALLHKSDLGGVITNIQNPQQLTTAWQNLQQKISLLNKKIRGPIYLQIQKQILDGLELIVGVKHDPVFGPVFLFGAGGQLAELIQDRNLHLLPLDQTTVEKLVSTSKIFPLLSGYRGHKPYPLKPLYQTILRLSRLAESLPQISEIEINPLLITQSHLWAVDTKVICQSSASGVN